MARRSSNESTSDLYIRLGLSLDELENGFVDAERTIRDNMARLSRENRIIELQMQVDVSALDEASDAEQILERRTDALNRMIANQQQRVNLANAELRNMVERHGENSDQAQRARLQFEHERLALARLEEQLRNLNETQEDAADGTSDLGDRIQELTDRFAPCIAALTATFAATQQLVEKFRELQSQAYELNLPFQETKEFLREMRLAGGDIGDFEGFIRGLSDAYVKGEWDDPEFIALITKYNAQLTDANGRLKDFKGLTEEVYQAYLKAKAAGEEIEFLQLVGGEAGVRDSIQYFERLKEAKEDASKVFDSGIDPRELHEAERALNLTTEQLGEFKDALISLATPAVTSALQDTFNLLREGTKIAVEYRDFLKPLAGTLIDAFTGYKGLDSFRDLFNAINADEAKEKAQALEELQDALSGKDNNPLSQYAAKRVKDFQDELKDLRLELDYAGHSYQLAVAKLDLWRKNELDDKLHVSDEERLAIEELYAAKREQLELERADRLDEIRERIAASERTALDNKIADINKAKDEAIDAGMAEAEALELAERQKNAAIEALENDFSSAMAALRQNSLQNTFDAIEKEKQAWIDKGIDEARAEEFAQQKKAQAIENALQKANELRQSTDSIEYDLTHSSLEKQIYDIERWKDAQLQKADTAQEVAEIIANAAMREADVFEREIERITGRTESVQDKLARLTLSSREYDRRAAYKELEKNLADNINPRLAQALFDAQMRKIDLNTLDDKSGRYSKSRMPPTKEEYKMMNADPSELAYKEMAQAVQKSAEASSQTVQQALEIVKYIEESKANQQNNLQDAVDSKPESFEVLYGDMVNDMKVQFGDLAQSAGNTTPNIDALGNSASNVANTFADVQSKLQSTKFDTIDHSGSFERPQPLMFEQAFATLAERFADVSQQMSNVAQSVQQRQPQPISLAPTINVDLGGAYVFDDKMKSQLTDDIVSEVSTAIKDAVEDATSREDYGYAR